MGSDARSSPSFTEKSRCPPRSVKSLAAKLSDSRTRQPMQAIPSLRGAVTGDTTAAMGVAWVSFQRRNPRSWCGFGGDRASKSEFNDAGTSMKRRHTCELSMSSMGCAAPVQSRRCLRLSPLSQYRPPLASAAFKVPTGDCSRKNIFSFCKWYYYMYMLLYVFLLPSKVH